MKKTITDPIYALKTIGAYYPQCEKIYTSIVLDKPMEGIEKNKEVDMPQGPDRLIYAFFMATKAPIAFDQNVQPEDIEFSEEVEEAIFARLFLFFQIAIMETKGLTAISKTNLDQFGIPVEFSARKDAYSDIEELVNIIEQHFDNDN